MGAAAAAAAAMAAPQQIHEGGVTQVSLTWLGGGQ